MIAPQYPRTIIECGSCGKSMDAELGECPRCRGGVYQGPLFSYLPWWHYKEFGEDLGLPAPDRERARIH